MKKTSTWTLCMAALILLMLVSCTVTNKARSYDYDYLYVTKQGIIQRPLVADLEVGHQKITIDRTYKNVTIKTAEQNVMEEFISTQHADLVIQPLYSVKAESNSARTTVEVILTGYPANYKNIRNYTPADKDNLLPMDYFPTLPSRSSAEEFTAPGKKTTVARAIISAAAQQ